MLEGYEWRRLDLKEYHRIYARPLAMPDSGVYGVKTLDQHLFYVLESFDTGTQSEYKYLHAYTQEPAGCTGNLTKQKVLCCMPIYEESFRCI